MSISNLPEAIVLRIQKARGLASESSLLIQKHRLDICSRCPEKKNDLGIARCGLCFCILELKTLVETESCKVGKW